MQLFNTGNFFLMAFITSSMIFVSSCNKKPSSYNGCSESSAAEGNPNNESSDQTTGELPNDLPSHQLKEIKADIPVKTKQSTVNLILDITASGISENIYKYKLGEAEATTFSSSNGYKAEHSTSQYIKKNTAFRNDNSSRLCVVTLGENGIWQDYLNASEFSWAQDLLLRVILSVTSSSPNGRSIYSEFIYLANACNEAVKVKRYPIFNLANGGSENHITMII